MIAVRDLHKSFGSQVVLSGVNLDIKRGENLVVLGRSGSGKSVLLRLIIGLMKPDQGSVWVDGLNVHALDYDELAELRKRFGMVFQMAALFDSMTVGENIGLALSEHTAMRPEEIAAIIAEKLALVNLHGIEAKKPADLSGGMRKRVGLARAIAMNPDYILYDEPTTGLDPVSAQRINVLIRKLQQKLNVTAVVVTHDMNTAYTVGDRLCLLHDGRIHFDGTPEAVRHTDDPAVRQFTRGEADGPLTDGYSLPARTGPAGLQGL